MTVDLEEDCKRILEERVCMADSAGRDCGNGCGGGREWKRE